MLRQITVALPPTVSGPFELSASQILDLENRNPAIGQMISDAITLGTPDLTTGYSFTDDVYGNVLISVDATGQLRIIAQSPINPNVINSPTYTSPTLPPGTCNTSILGLCLDQLFSTIQSGVGLVAIGAVIWLMSGKSK